MDTREFKRERKEDGSCERVNGISGSMQRRKFIEQLKN
jgi:hypothetical protein